MTVGQDVLLEELRNLVALRDSGSLTSEEFEEQAARLLSDPTSSSGPGVAPASAAAPSVQPGRSSFSAAPAPGASARESPPATVSPAPSGTRRWNATPAAEPFSASPQASTAPQRADVFGAVPQGSASPSPTSAGASPILGGTAGMMASPAGQSDPFTAAPQKAEGSTAMSTGPASAFSAAPTTVTPTPTAESFTAAPTGLYSAAPVASSTLQSAEPLPVTPTEQRTRRRRMSRRGRHSVSGGSSRTEDMPTRSTTTTPSVLPVSSPWAAAPVAAPSGDMAVTPVAPVAEEPVVTDLVAPPEVPEASPSSIVAEEIRDLVVDEPEPTGEILLEPREELATELELSETPSPDAASPLRQPVAPLWSASGTTGVSLSGTARDTAPVAPAVEHVVAEPRAEQPDIAALAEAALYLPADESEEEAAPTIVQIERQRGLIPGSYWDMSNRYVPPAPEVEEGVVSRPLEGTYWDRTERVMAQATESDEVEDTASQAGGYWDRSTIRR